MKKVFVFVVSCIAFCNIVFSQNNMRPLTGNGKTKTVSYDLKDFDMLEILWVDGKITVEYGAPKSEIVIATDENIYNLLDIQNTEGVLKLEITGNYRNRLWLEDDKTAITIRTTKQPREIVYKANANIFIKGINTGILTLDKDENGDMTLEGKVMQLIIQKKDNGNIDARSLIAEQASVIMGGNGDVAINAKQIVKEKVTGNGGIRNVQTKSTSTIYVPQKRVNITFFNPSDSKKEYYVTGTNERGRKFSYGLGLGAMSRQKEYLPIGTRIYYKGKNVATLKESDDEQVVRL